MPLLPNVLAEPEEKMQFLCEPYIARQGITFLHGKTSLGKSPLTWEFARCVSQGLPFFHQRTYEANVLYLEADTAKRILVPRLKLIPEPRGTWWIEFLVGRPVNLLDGNNWFHKWARDFPQLWTKPELVIWNTLRQFYRGKAVDSEVPMKVYQAMISCFPEAGHLVTAHDRKASLDPEALQVEDEEFSGSKAWADLAQVALHLVRAGDTTGEYLRLKHTKTQVSALLPPISLDLDIEGTILTCRTDEKAQAVAEAMGKFPEGSKRARAKEVAKVLGMGERTVWKYLGVLQQK